MTVTVRLFAGARDLAGADSIRIELPAGATVGDLRQGVAQIQPKLRALLTRAAIAVEYEVAPDSLLLGEDSEIALLPAVSGG